MSRNGRNFKISIGIKALLVEETEPADGKRNMRASALGLILSVVALPCFAQTILKTEPLSLAPYQTAYVADSACGAGKVLRVTGAMRNLPRKKACVALGLEQASLSDRPL
jgi:hypothetical protein